MDLDKKNGSPSSPQPAEEPVAVPPETPPQGEKSRRRRKILWIIAAVLGGLLLVLTALALTWKWWSKPMAQPIWNENVQMEEEPQQEEVEATPDLPPVAQVQNIALFGIDQKKGSSGRSDALLILSVDRVHNKIKLISLDRDSLVAIDGHGEEKLTHAWAYGQGKLAVKTLNQNFGMNITDYAYINFSEFVDVIDFVGGVTVDMTAEELEYTNSCWIDWVAKYGDWEMPKIAGTGYQHLNGAQALSYARNRSDGTGRRADRLREVLSATLDQIKQQPFYRWKSTLERLLQLCHTTLTFDEAWELGMWVLEEAPTIEQLSLPTTDLKPWGGIIDNQRGWVRVYDLEAAAAVLYRFIYETDSPLPDSSEPEPTQKTEKTTTATP